MNTEDDALVNLCFFLDDDLCEMDEDKIMRYMSDSPGISHSGNTISSATVVNSSVYISITVAYNTIATSPNSSGISSAIFITPFGLNSIGTFC